MTSRRGTSVRSGWAALPLLAMLAPGCLGGSPRPEFYALSPANPPGMAPVASRPELGLAVGPLELPRYLDRPGTKEAWPRQDHQAYRLASRLPWVMDLYLRRVGRRLEAGDTSGLLAMFPALPPSDAAALERDDVRETLRTSILEALRQGPRGARHDYALEGRRWGVPLGEIEVPVELWHGQDDRIVSPEQGRILANALPDVSRHFPEGEGHLSIAVNRLDEIFASAG